MKTMYLERLLKLLTLSLICNFVRAQSQIEIDSVTGFGRDAIRITYAPGDGIHVIKTGESGFQVDNAGAHGIFVQNAGGLSLNILGNKNISSAGPEDHIAQIYNQSTGTSPDVLALKVGGTANLEGQSILSPFIKETMRELAGSKAIIRGVYYTAPPAPTMPSAWQGYRRRK
jgi:hypothetical protein